jgi:hypothetical protein
MKLADMPGKNNRYQSKMEKVPEPIRAQLLDAYRNDTHSHATMVSWAQSEGYDVTKNSLANWFASLPYTRGDAVTDG